MALASSRQRKKIEGQVQRIAKAYQQKKRRLKKQDRRERRIAARIEAVKEKIWA